MENLLSFAVNLTPLSIIKSIFLKKRSLEKAAGHRRLLVMLVGEPFKEILTQPSLRTSQPAEVGQVVDHLLDELYLLVHEAALQGSHRGGSLCEPRAHRSKRAWFRFFSLIMRPPQRPGFYPTHLEKASTCLGKGHGHSTGFAFSREAGQPHTFPQPISEKSGQRRAEPHHRG